MRRSLLILDAMVRANPQAIRFVPQVEGFEQ